MIKDEIKENGNQQSYLSFKLGDEMFAVEVSKVLEILELRPITKIPHAPVYMKGVINLRGSVLPVLDTRIKFGIDVKEQTVDTCIVVFMVNMEGSPLTLGAMVDSVEEVMEINDSDIGAPPSVGSKFNPEYLLGMIKDDETFIMVLNIDKVFSADELIIAQQAHETVPA